MGFSVVWGTSVGHVWVPIVDSDTCYVGQIVACQANEGVVPIGAASGANDTTGKLVPMGVVIGTNNRRPSYDSTYKTEKITDATPLATTTEFTGVEGPWAKGDRQAMVEVALIDQCTVLKGRLFNAAYGTAITVGTVSTGDSNGVSCTSSAVEVAGVAGLASLYFRGGANAGAYRITDDTSTTAITWDKPTYAAVAVGDTLVRANGLRVFGPSRAQFDSEATYIDNSAALTSDYYGLDVIKLDLSKAGEEHVYFRFNADHFALKRA